MQLMVKAMWQRSMVPGAHGLHHVIYWLILRQECPSIIFWSTNKPNQSSPYSFPMVCLTLIPFCETYVFVKVLLMAKVWHLIIFQKFLLWVDYEEVSIMQVNILTDMYIHASMCYNYFTLICEQCISQKYHISYILLKISEKL
jgi:hypothetical protein